MNYEDHSEKPKDNEDEQNAVPPNPPKHIPMEEAIPRTPEQPPGSYETQESSHLAESTRSKLTFKRSAILIAVMIISYQMVALAVGIYFGVDLFFGENEELPLNYYLVNNGIGIVWFFVFLFVVLMDIYRHDLIPSDLFKWDLDIFLRYIPIVILYFIPCALFVALISFIVPGTELGMAEGNPLVMALTFISAVILAPIIEEMIFRGYLQTAMLDEFKRPRERIVVNGMLFAAAHMFILVALVSSFPYYIFVLGFLFAKLYDETRSILPGILLHALNNLLVFCIDLYKTFQDTGGIVV